MAALIESLRALRSRRNALVCISCLPPEVLATIFTYIFEEETFNSYRSTRLPASVIVTYVCRHWCQAALEYPTLWVYIDCASGRRPAIMLERSENATLVVTCSAPLSLGICVREVLSQLPRIKFLQLLSSSENDNDIFDCLSSQPAPLLQAFKFSVVGYSLLGISGTIFEGRAPQLRSIELMQCPFICMPYVFRSLQTLDVRRIAFTLNYTMSQILSVLRHMPDLERLTLDQLSINKEDTKLFDQVPLTRLRSIALHSCIVETATSLFSHLILPVDVRIALSLERAGKYPSDRRPRWMLNRCDPRWRLTEPYPSLRALELEKIDFLSGELEDLRDTLIMRANHDVGIHELRLVKCRNLLGYAVQLVGEVVGEVDWDGHEVAVKYCFPFVRSMGDRGRRFFLIEFRTVPSNLTSLHLAVLYDV